MKFHEGFLVWVFSHKKMAASVAMVRPLDLCYNLQNRKILHCLGGVNLHILNDKKYLFQTEQAQKGFRPLSAI